MNAYAKYMESPSRLAVWEQRVRGSTRGYSEYQVQEIARLCYEAEGEDPPPCVWHMAAIVGRHKCQCDRCQGESIPPMF